MYDEEVTCPNLECRAAAAGERILMTVGLPDMMEHIVAAIVLRSRALRAHDADINDQSAVFQHDGYSLTIEDGGAANEVLLRIQVPNDDLVEMERRLLGGLQ